MAIITKIDKAGPAGRARVYLDGRFAFSLEAEAALGLEKGQELSAEAAEALSARNEALRARASAYRILALRPHSERELRQKLARQHFADAIINKLVADLTERRLLDDAAFARFWCENREAFRPRSRRLTGLELRRKGVAAEIVAEATAGIDDAESAYRAGARKARLLAGAGEETFRLRVGEYLRRRGYGYETARSVAERLWREIQTMGGQPPG